eukprot:371669_1
MTTVSLQRNHPKKVNVHSLPCKIKYTGKAKVSDYFVETEAGAPLPNECGINGSIVNDTLKQDKYSYDQNSCYFRGRALLKSTIEFKDGICGYELNKTETAWETKGVFEHINVWRLTNKKRDKYERTINNWYTINAALHNPIATNKTNSEESM